MCRTRTVCAASGTEPSGTCARVAASVRARGSRSSAPRDSAAESPVTDAQQASPFGVWHRSSPVRFNAHAVAPGGTERATAPGAATLSSERRPAPSLLLLRPSLDPLGLTALLPVHRRERCRCGPRCHRLLVRSTRPRHLGEAPLELASAPPQLLELLDRAVEPVLQIVGEGRQTDDVVECLGRQMRLVSQPTLGGLVLPASGFGWPLAWPTTARPRCLFTLLSDHGRIVAHFRA